MKQQDIFQFEYYKDTKTEIIKYEYDGHSYYEQWMNINIEEYREKYQVSNLGRVRSLKRDVVTSAGVKKTFNSVILKQLEYIYLFVNLSIDGKMKRHRVHGLVCLTFHDNLENKPIVNHKDGNKLNNFYLNLEWATHKENTRHAFDTGLQLPTWKGVKGKKNPFIKPIYQFTKSGIFVRKYYGISEASRETNINLASISSCANKKRFKSAGGYVWSFTEQL